MDKEKMIGNGDAERCRKKVAELRKEKRRRLILNDSDSDEPSVFACEKANAGQCQNGIRSIARRDIDVKRIEDEEGRVDGEEKKKVDLERMADAGRSSDVKENGIRRMKDGDVEMRKNTKFELDENSKRVVLNKRIMGSIVINKEADTNGMEVGQTQLEEKSAKLLDTEVPLERIKTYSYKLKEGKCDIVYSKKPKMDSVGKHVVAKGINAEILGGSGVLTDNRKKRKNVSDKLTDSDSNHINSTSAEIVKQTYGSDDLGRKKLKDQSSCVVAEKNIMSTGIYEVKGNVLMVQDKTSGLKFLPRNEKVGRVDISHAKRGYEERTRTLGSSRSPSKQLSLSEDRKVHQKLATGDSPSKNTAKRTASLSSKDGLKVKAKCKLLSSQANSKRINMSNSKSDMKDNNNCKSKPSVLTKKRNEVFSTDKQKLRDHIKSILLSAGWKIDLRPRRGKNYLDSVYIPPEGKGSYWSITKAYDVYQHQLNSLHTDKSSKSGMRSMTSSLSVNKNDFDIGSSSSVIPTDSLNILRRVVVNKRRSREELEDAERDKIKKMKGSVKKSLSLQKKKKSNDRLVSKIDVTAVSRVQTGLDKQKKYALLARGANREAKISNDNYIVYDGKRTVLAWMIDLGVIHENEKVKYLNSTKSKSSLEGLITRDGIYCSCCSKTLTIENFGLHGGSKQQQASENIYIKDQGVSLLQCQLTAWEKQPEAERHGFYTVDLSDDDPNDDTCGICGDGGDLICCDNCPSTFHLNCLGIQMLPPGDWNCTNCSCKFCGTVSRAAAEEVDGTVTPLLSCSQCEEKYHQNCLQETNSVSACCNSSKSFCGQSCRTIFKQLQKLLGVKNDLEAGFSWTLTHRFDDDVSRYKLSRRVECNSKIAVAFAVMDECFEPIIDQRSGVNLIHNVVYNYGSNFNRLNYRGFYTFILERGDEIISAASVRIHGTKLAEMPFIGTRNTYRRQGMCRRLLDGIETALRSLNVEKLVIPAISELKDTWTTVFGFKPFETSQELEARSINLLVFPGTGLLLKPLLGKVSGQPLAAADRVAKVEGDKIRQHDVQAVHRSSECDVIHQTSNEVLFQLNNKHTGPNSISDGRINSISNEHQSEIKTLECKPSEVSDQPCTQSHLHVAPCLEPIEELESQVEQTAEFLSEIKANDDSDMTSMNDISLNLSTIHQQSAKNSIVSSA